MTVKIKTYSLRTNETEYGLTISYFAQRSDGSNLSELGPSHKVD